MSDMCLLFILIFQSISCRNIMLSSCSPVQIYYITIMPKNFHFSKKMFHVKCCSTYAYNWVHFWFLQFPEQLLYPVLHIYFQITLDFLLFLKCIYLLLSTSFWDHISFNALCLHLVHKSTPLCHTCTYTML